MIGNSLSQSRRRIGYGLTALVASAAAWAASPGLPVLWAPRASAAAKAEGLALFEHEWEPDDALAGGDGLGPVFNGRSCVACHFQGGVGGGGNSQHNVVSFEALPTVDRPKLKGGLIHAFAVSNKFTERVGDAPRDVPGHAQGSVTERGVCNIISIHDFDPIRTESVNSPPLFGAGWVDRISGKTIHQLGLRKAIRARSIRELDGQFEGILPGRPRVLADGRIGKFGWKAQFASLEDFVAAACANEIGLGNPKMEQAKPIGHDYPSMAPDLDRKQFRHLDRLRRHPAPARGVVARLPRPTPRSPRTARTSSTRSAAPRATRPTSAGSWGSTSDFLLHRLDDRRNGGTGYTTVSSTPEVPLPARLPACPRSGRPRRSGAWPTPPLLPRRRLGKPWKTAIARHHGDAEVVSEAYVGLGDNEKKALIAFLKTLKAPSDARPADPSLASPGPMTSTAD